MVFQSIPGIGLFKFHCGFKQLFEFNFSFSSCFLRIVISKFCLFRSTYILLGLLYCFQLVNYSGLSNNQHCLFHSFFDKNMLPMFWICPSKIMFCDFFSFAYLHAFLLICLASLKDQVTWGFLLQSTHKILNLYKYEGLNPLNF